MQQGQELVEEAFLAFFGELPAEAKHAAPEHGAEIVHVLVWGHPVARGSHQSLIHLLKCAWSRRSDEGMMVRRTREPRSRNLGQRR